MPEIRVIPHGGCGVPAVIRAATVAEAIEGWSRQQDFSHFAMADRPVLEVVDFETEEKLRAPAEVTEVHVAPAMFGGGGFGKILVGAAIIGLSFIPGIGHAIQMAMISMGVSLALGGIAQLFLKAPELAEDPDPSKYLGAGGNTTEIGTLIGMGGGRMMVGGQFLSMQVNSSDMAMGTYPDTPI